MMKLFKIFRHSFLRINIFSFNTNDKNFSKDEKYWEEFTKRKAEQKELQTLDTRFNQINQLEFKYSSGVMISAEELINCIDELSTNIRPNFCLIDVRTEFEIAMYKFPSRTKVLRIQLL